MKTGFYKIIPARGILPMIVAIFPISFPATAAPHTPKPGTPERQAICDGVREYLISKVAQRKLPQPVVFKIGSLRVENNYAWFEGIPLFKDGSYVSPEYLPDVDYVMILHSSGGRWKVTNDLSRSDVPSDEEADQIRNRLPRKMPASIVPASWRKLLRMP